MADTTRSVVWVDAAGRTRQTILRGNASLGSIAGQLRALSNADRQREWEGGTVINAAPAPVTAAYPGVQDYAVLVYQDGAGDLVQVTLPAPVAAIFLPDGSTVNPPAIAGLNGAVVGTLLTGAGNVVTAYVGGFRRRAGKEY